MTSIINIFQQNSANWRQWHA